MANLVENKSLRSLFDSPSIVVESKAHPTAHRPKCSTQLVSGSFFTVATSPDHGEKITDFPASIDYTLVRSSGAEFSSSMVGSSIRLFNLEIEPLFYTGLSGKQSVHSGLIARDFSAKVKSVISSNVLKLETPVYVSDVTLDSDIYEESSPYFETDTSYYVTNIKQGNFDMVHIPRIGTSELSSSAKVCSIITATLENLQFSAVPNSYRVLKKSLNTPETATCVALGKVEANELLLTKNTNIDYQNGGQFYSLSHVQSYWFASPGLTYTHTPDIMMDSITLDSSGNSNETEALYIIFKENTGEVSRDYQYVAPTYQSGSAWYTSPALFENFDREPDTYYSCSVENAKLLEYSGSIEVVNNGSALNSNSIKMLKNTMYEFSVNWANIQYSSTNYKLEAFFITTSPNGTTQKFLLGSLDKNTATTYSGTYKSKFFTPKTMFGTIIITPKYINTIAVANVSLKPYSDTIYALDSFSIEFPYTPIIKNEKVKLTVEILDVSGQICMNPLKAQLHVDPEGYTEQLVGSALIADLIYDGGGP